MRLAIDPYPLLISFSCRTFKHFLKAVNKILIFTFKVQFNFESALLKGLGGSAGTVLYLCAIYP